MVREKVRDENRKVKRRGKKVRVKGRIRLGDVAHASCCQRSTYLLFNSYTLTAGSIYYRLGLAFNERKKKTIQ